MKNKKLFKTIAISATTTIAAAAVIAAPLVVMASKANLKASKKVGVSNGLTIKSIDGKTDLTSRFSETTPIELEANESLYFRVFDANGKELRPLTSQKATYGGVEIDLDDDLINAGADAEWIYGEATEQRTIRQGEPGGSDFGTQNPLNCGVISACHYRQPIEVAEDKTGLITFTFPNDSEGNPQVVSTKLTIKSHTGEYTNVLHYQFEGYDYDKTPDMYVNQTYYVQIKTDESTPFTTVTPSDVIVDGLVGTSNNKILSVTQTGGTNRFAIKVNNVTGFDRIRFTFPGYEELDLEFEVTQEESKKLYLKNEGSASYRVLAENSSMFALLDGSSTPVLTATSSVISDPESYITVTHPTATDNNYLFTAGTLPEIYDTGLYYSAFYTLSANGYSSVQVPLYIDPSDSPICDKQIISLKPGESTDVTVTYSKSGGAMEISEVVDTMQPGEACPFEFTISTEDPKNKVTIKAKESAPVCDYHTIMIVNSLGDRAMCYASITSNLPSIIPSSTTVSVATGADELVSFTDESGAEVTGLTVTVTSGTNYVGATVLSETSNQVKISGYLIGNAQILVSKDGYESVMIPITITQGTDYSVAAAEETPHGKVGTEFTTTFTPKTSSVRPTMTKDDWLVKISDASPAVATVKSWSITGTGTDAKILVTFQATVSGTPGSGIVEVYHKSNNFQLVQGQCAFYVHQYNVALSGKPTNPSVVQAGAKLTATVDTEEPAAGDIVWKSLDPDYCEVDQEGQLTYLKPCEEDKNVTIRATHKDDPWSYDEVTFHIQEPTLKIFVGDQYIPTIEDKVATTAGVKNTKQLTLKDTVSETVLTTSANVTWSSSTTAVASVESGENGGKVTYEGMGNTTITATFATASSQYTATASVEFELTGYQFKFTNTNATAPTTWTTSSWQGVSMYEVGRYSNPKELSVEMVDPSATHSLSDISYTVVALNAETGAEEPASTAAITISDAGVVSFVTDAEGNPIVGYVGIKARCKSLKDASDEFVVVYHVTDEQFIINGWTADQDTLSTTGRTLSVVKADDPETPISSDDYTITWKSSKNSVIAITDTGVLTYYKYLYIEEEETWENKSTITATIKNNKTGYQTTTELADIYVGKDDLSCYESALSGSIGSSATAHLVLNGTTISGALSEPGAKVEFFYNTETGKTPVATVTTQTETNTGLVEFAVGGTGSMRIEYTARTGATVQTVARVPISVSTQPILLNYTWVTGTAGNDSVQLKAYNQSTEITFSNIEYTSEDTNVATVDNTSVSTTHGQIHLKAAGTTRIKASYTNGTTEETSIAYCEVTVSQSSLVLSHTSIEATDTDEGAQLHAYLNGTDVTSSVEWSSDKTACVTVSAGKLTYKAATTEAPANITATLESSQEAPVTCKVQLTKSVLSYNVKTGEGEANMNFGVKDEEQTIKFFVNGIQQQITSGKIKGHNIGIVSSDTNILEVDAATGKVTFKAKGTAHLTVTWYSGESTTETRSTHEIYFTVI